MIVDLTPAQMNEVRDRQEKMLGRLLEHAKDNDDPWAVEHAEKIKAALPDLSNFIIRHQKGAYSYLPSLGEGYSWEKEQYPFHNELREKFQRIFEESDSGDMVDTAKDLFVDGSRSFISDYGVCDNIDQIFREWPQLLEDPRKFIIKINEVRREDQPESGGWRWHKNGPYIGDLDPGGEYLYEDTHIDNVLTFEIVRVG